MIRISLIKITIKLISTRATLLILKILRIIVNKKLQTATKIFVISFPKIIDFKVSSHQLLHPCASFLPKFHWLDCWFNDLRLTKIVLILILLVYMITNHFLSFFCFFVLIMSIWLSTWFLFLNYCLFSHLSTF